MKFHTTHKFFVVYYFFFRQHFYFIIDLRVIRSSILLNFFNFQRELKNLFFVFEKNIVQKFNQFEFKHFANVENLFEFVWKIFSSNIKTIYYAIFSKKNWKKFANNRPFVHNVENFVENENSYFEYFFDSKIWWNLRLSNASKLNFNDYVEFLFFEYDFVEWYVEQKNIILIDKINKNDFVFKLTNASKLNFNNYVEFLFFEYNFVEWYVEQKNIILIDKINKNDFVFKLTNASKFRFKFTRNTKIFFTIFYQMRRVKINFVQS